MKHIVKQANNIDQAAISRLPNGAEDSDNTDVSTFLVIVFICFLFSLSFVIFGSCLFDNTVPIELDGTININEASAASMMRLPGIGISKAGSIILYRQNCGQEKAFESCDDLTNIHGIGVKTADNMKQYIRFK